MKMKMKIVTYWKPFIIALVILYGSITSSSNLNKFDLIHLEHLDKLVHFILYFGLGLTFFTSIKKNIFISKRDITFLTLVLVISYGVIMEVLQFYFTIDRSADIMDVLANSLGCISGIIIYPLLHKIKLTRYL
ncbi:MAG: hypothetical protein C0597_11510 [Marinilabiliales bacterium]|nr:MAG: hypothetical protein C0597_11510 [Marinilabiliales bacterium]